MHAQPEPQPRYSASPVARACEHCGNAVPEKLERFCCAGCRTVFELLQSRGLGDFYRLQNQGRFVRAAVPAPSDPGDFDYLDNPEFRGLYSSDASRMRFYLEGAHCTACVWLTEKLGDFVPGVRMSRLDLGSSVAEVSLDEGGRFGAVARELARLGYRPHPLPLEDSGEVQRRADSLQLARLGVAAFCAGNIMLSTASLYAGAQGTFAELFRWLAFALALPVLTFSAVPFYRGAWAALRSRSVSIDVPIAVGILLGGVCSIINLFSGSPYLYFDSLTSLVALMLGSRLLLFRAQRYAEFSSRAIHFLSPARARAQGADRRFFEVAVDQLKRGDRIEVRSGETFPVDGVVIEGESLMNNSFLTGESLPVAVNPGSPVFAGAMNDSGRLLVEVSGSGASSRLGRLLRSVEESRGRRAPISVLADRAARIFVTAVLISIPLVFGVGLRAGFQHAVDLALALAIVTCPCAFALATPLAFSVTLSRLARSGILLRGADTLERLSMIQGVYFDKTGTLTEGKLEVVTLTYETSVAPHERDEIGRAWLALESRSNHPVARAIVERLSPAKNLPSVENFRERAGLGVSGTIDGRRYEARALADGPDARAARALTEIELLRDGARVARASLSDRLRSEASTVVARLRRQGYALGVLSGDSQGAVAGVGQALGFREHELASGLSPEAKEDILKNRPHSLLIGDGANDAPALARADVGLAIRGGAELSLASADGYFQRGGLAGVEKVLVAGRETMKVVRRGFTLSLLYNLFGIVGVAMGWVTPLFAAVLMPLSSLTVIASCLIGTATLRRALQEATP